MRVRHKIVDGIKSFLGPLIVTCEKGDIKQTQDGILIYGEEEKKEIPLAQAMVGRQAEITELYEAVVNGRPMFHDGRWGEATLEVCLGILQSRSRAARSLYVAPGSSYGPLLIPTSISFFVQLRTPSHTTNNSCRR